MVLNGSLPFLTEGPGCSSAPFLAAVCRWWWSVVPRHSWLRVLAAVPHHSWLGSAASGGERSLAISGSRPWVQFPAFPGWGRLPLVGVLLMWGGWVCSVCVCGVRRVHWRVCGPWCGGLGARDCVGVACVSLVRVRLHVRVVLCPSPILAEGPGCSPPPFLARGRCWCSAGFSPILAEGPNCSSPPFLAGVCRWCWWVVPHQSWLRALGAVPRHSWLGCAAGVVGGPSPILAEGPGCGSPPFLARVSSWWWWVFPCQSWLRAPVAVACHCCLESVGDVGWWSLANPG